MSIRAKSGEVNRPVSRFFDCIRRRNCINFVLKHEKRNSDEVRFRQVHLLFRYTPMRMGSFLHDANRPPALFMLVQLHAPGSFLWYAIA